MPKKVLKGKKVSKATIKVKAITKGKKVIEKKEIKREVEKPKGKVQKIQKNTKRNAKVNGQEILELGLLMDCTGSMASWIERAKKTL